MRIGKLTFTQANIRNIQNTQNYITTMPMASLAKPIGILAVIFNFLIIIYPFYSSYCKDKIGLNNLKNNKYNLISTALRHVNKTPQYTIMLISAILTTLLLYNKGFFSRIDQRIIVPISLYGILIVIYSMTKIIPERYILHNGFAIFFAIFGFSLVYFIDTSYSEYFVDSDLTRIHTLTIILISCITIGLGLGLYNIYNNYVRKFKLFPKYIPFVRNLIGFFEIAIFLIIGIAFAIMISYPPLPDTNPEFTIF